MRSPITPLNLGHSVTFQVVLEQCDGFLNEVLNVERSSDAGILPEVRPDALEHRSRAMSISSDLLEPRFGLVEIGSLPIEPA